MRTVGDGYYACDVNPRVKMAALWASIMTIFAYVDLFSLYREDVRADLAVGKLGGFTVNQTFLLATTAYIIVPSVMIAASVIVAARPCRVINLVLAIAYGLSIIAGAIGEWNYYLLGSAVEVAELAAIGYLAWTWPKRPVAVPAHRTLAPVARLGAR